MSNQRYTPEFKDEAVRQVLDRGYPVAEVAERDEPLVVPQLALQRQGELELFDDPSQLRADWQPSIYEAAPSGDDIRTLDANRVAEGGTVDVDEHGGVHHSFCKLV